MVVRNNGSASSVKVWVGASLREHLKGKSGLVVECLKEALLLPVDMQEFRCFRKHEVFLSLKRDLANVHDHFLLYLKQITHALTLQYVQVAFVAEE